MLKVIGAGFGRTGTTSMKAALEHLGFGPTYHMFEVLAQPGRMTAWTRVLEGEAPDWHQIFGGFQSCLDWPAVTYWRELCAAYPRAKVLLTVREPERWYESTHNTIYQFVKHGHGVEPAREDVTDEDVAAFESTIREQIWDRTFGGRFEDKAHAISVFEAHNAAVREAIPAERLLEYRPGDGWGPLCDFLGVETPQEDFPHVNDRGSIQDLVSHVLSEGKLPTAFT